MGLPAVSVSLANGRLGRVALPDDRVVGLILNHVVGLNDPRVLYGAADLSKLLPTIVSSSPHDLEVQRQVNAFYQVAGEGAELWLMLVPTTVTGVQLFTDPAQAKFLTDAAQGRINVLGVGRYLAGSAITMDASGISADTAACIDEAHAFGVAQASQNVPLRILLDAQKWDGTTNLTSLRTLAYNRVGVCLAGSSATLTNAPMGALLGRIASTPTNHNIGAVADGPQQVEAWFADGTVASTKSFGALGALYDRGFLFLRKHIGRGGYYWAGDPMATLITDDYAYLADGRVIDKVHRIAYDVFVGELLATVAVDPNTGKIVKATLKRYQAEIERAVEVAMGDEISGVVAFVDPNQDILGTGILNVDLRVIPTGTNRTIHVTLGFSNPNLP